MPVIIPTELPATAELKAQNIFVMNDTRAVSQDIRPLKIGILNLMPDKITTETQLLRKLGNSLIQVEIILLAIEDHVPKNTSQSHLDSFYRYFSDVKDEFFDGIIVTGAPIEHLPFEEVTYWKELEGIFEWINTNVYASLFICWASQAAFQYYYGIGKEKMDSKLFGVFPHNKADETSQLLFGMDDTFYVPHSRNTRSYEDKIRNHPDLTVVADSKEAGIHIVESKNKRRIFMSGHPEYDIDTLNKEYLRDKDLGLGNFPVNYFAGDNPANGISSSWISSASLFYQNWLNYYVYQETNYDLENVVSTEWKEKFK